MPVNQIYNCILIISLSFDDDFDFAKQTFRLIWTNSPKIEIQINIRHKLTANKNCFVVSQL